MIDLFFRLGIFDEVGFLGDPMYPNYYKINGRILPTGKQKRNTIKKKNLLTLSTKNIHIILYQGPPMLP